MQFIRFQKQIGETNFNKIQDLTILIIGLGGVGGYALESLVRSGINHLIIIDHDKIDITNLNRQIISNHDNIGHSKAKEWLKRINTINPNCKVTVIEEFINKDNINILDDYQIDYLVDACDSLFTKLLLIKYCQSNSIKLISSMGTGNKLNPEQLTITKLSKTKYDPIAKKLRKYIKDNRLKDIMVVSSSEQPISNDAPFITSNAFVPATAGLLITNYIINDIIRHT